MQQGHLDDKREQVVDDGVEELVGHLAPGEVRHGLELVVEVQLRGGGREDKLRAQKWGAKDLNSAPKAAATDF